MSEYLIREASLTATADALRVKLGTTDPITWEVDQGFKTAVESIQSGEPVYDPTDVKFGSEPIDPDQLYKVGYNWVAQVVDHLQDMVGKTASFTLEEIVYWIGRVKYIPQGYAESVFSLVFDTGANAWLPNVQKGIASAEFSLIFETIATGALDTEEV